MDDDRKPDCDDPVEALIEECLLRHETEGSGVVDDVCRRHPEHADAVRDGLRQLRMTGLANADEPTVDAFPDQLGDFRLLERLGGGGMGVVFLARQESLGREVAVKLIRPERLYFGASRDRFRREVEAVARLQHPGIAQVLMAGEEGGLPFFAMEYVRGCTLAEAVSACDGGQPELMTGADLARAAAACTPGKCAPNLGVELFAGSWGRVCLRIVLEVARALQHAHERSVLHRDVKPSNVMITPDGRVLLIDFGLARTEGGVDLTVSGSPMGSLKYMSPEQLEGRQRDVGPGTDVYSLGVLLYELLVLANPYEARSAEITCRRILEGRPQSLRARNRAVSVDAETVCLKAMDPDPARRYASAADLATDLDNVLAYRPIEAKRPGPLLRMRRFAQRRPGAAAAIGLAVVVVVGLPLLLWMMERSHRLEVEAEAEVANRTTEFLEQLFEAASPGRSLGQQLSVRSMVDIGSKQIENALRDQPEIRARLLATFGRVYRYLGVYDESERLLLEAHRSLSTFAEPDDDLGLDVRWRLARLAHTRGDHTRAEASFRELVDELTSTHGPDSAEVGYALTDLAAPIHAQGRDDEAEPMLRRAVGLVRASPARDELRLATSLSKLASFLVDTRRPAAARPLFEESLAICRRVYPTGAPIVVENLRHLGRCLTELGEYDAARGAIETALAESERLLPADHEAIAFDLLTSANLLKRTGHRSVAAEQLERALVIVEAKLGADHTTAAWIRNDLGTTLETLGEYDLAATHLRRALAIYRQAHPDGHRNVAIALHNLAGVLANTGQQDEAEELAEQNLSLRQRLGLDASDLAFAHQRLSLIHNLLGNAARAEREAELALELVGGDAVDRPFVARTLDFLGWARATQLDRDGAEAALQKAVAMFERLFPDGHPDTANAMDRLAKLFVADRPADALPLFSRALEIRREYFPRDHRWLWRSIHNLAIAHHLTGDARTARALVEEVLSLLEEHAARPDADLVASLFLAARLAHDREDLEAAERYAKDCLQQQRALFGDGTAAVATTEKLLRDIEARRDR